VSITANKQLTAKTNTASTGQSQLCRDYHYPNTQSSRSWLTWNLQAQKMNTLPASCHWSVNLSYGNNSMSSLPKQSKWHFTASTNQLLLKITKWEEKHMCHRVPHHLVNSPNQASYQDKWNGYGSNQSMYQCQSFTLIGKLGSVPSTCKMEATCFSETLPASKTVSKPRPQPEPP
jgi:hypothetical protein